MKQAILLASAGALALSGCATVTAEETPTAQDLSDAACSAEAGQRFIGQKATAEVGAQLLEATGARELRWVPPRTAVTMDFRPDRLTVSYNDEMIITQVSCT